jgi:hypothetical protein
MSCFATPDQVACYRRSSVFSTFTTGAAGDAVVLNWMLVGEVLWCFVVCVACHGTAGGDSSNSDG